METRRERHLSRWLRFQGITLHVATILMLVAFDDFTLSLQIIFRFEPSGDLLDHFATIGIVD